MYYLLVDLQTKVEGSQRSAYRHFAAKALTEQGVESVAHVEVPFDPSYQSLTLHSILVHRQGRVMSKLGDAKVKILQRERELEALIYDGSKTANVFLEDVRVGDVVEYSYTLDGTNPALATHQFGRFDLQWRVPVHRLAARLLWPVDRPIVITNRHTNAQPVVGQYKNFRDYRWHLSDRAPLLVESDAPRWFDPYPTVQWGEFKDWSDVARWARPLYQRRPVQDVALQREIDRIARESSDPGQRALAVLNFAQSAIRYLGIEVGAGSYRPNPPSVVLQRRFGDCKDKTLLTLTMLDALGIDAAPALVNTRSGQAIHDLQPTPGVFNHVIVRARIGDRTYWLDPTRAPQHGTLDVIHQPDFGRALVLEYDSKGLTLMHPDKSRADKRSVHALFEVPPRSEAPVPYTVTTVLRGGEAEAMRGRLKQENREDLQNRYLNHYARYYSGLTMARPMEVSDDLRANELTTIEHYLIPGFWTRSEERHRQEASVHAPDVHDSLRQPAQSVRVAPLATPYPMDLTHVTELRLPEQWPIKPEVSTVVDETFELERRSSVEGNTIRLTDHLRWHTDHVSAADMQRYMSKLQQARALGHYELFWQTDSGPRASSWARINWPVALLGILLAGLLSWLAIRFYQYDPPMDRQEAKAPFEKPIAIGGWLLLPAFGLVMAVLRRTQGFVQTLPSYSADTWAYLTTAGSAAYHHLWAPLLLLELGGNLTIIVFTAVLAVMFFQKRHTVPMAYVCLQGFAMIFLVIDYFGGQAIPAAASRMTEKETQQVIWTAIWGLLWCAYFLKSERVKKTFVRQYRTSGSP